MVDELLLNQTLIRIRQVIRSKVSRGGYKTPLRKTGRLQSLLNKAYEAAGRAAPDWDGTLLHAGKLYKEIGGCSWAVKKKKPINKHPNTRLIYKNYIASDSWKHFRMFVFREIGDWCERCHKKGQHVHHLHYQTLRQERLEDVQVLCSACHKKEHEGGKNKFSTKAEFIRHMLSEPNAVNLWPRHYTLFRQ